MFWEAFKVTGSAMVQLFLLAAVGFFLIRKEVLGHEGLDALSRLVMEITLPVLIFCQLIKDFTFSMYSNWWLFPLLSIAVTAVGLAVGMLFCGFIRGHDQKMQFLNLVAFQNSGYLPLPLVAAILPPPQAELMFIYLFLFLMGFNLVMFSLGSYLLASEESRRFEWKSLFSPPVVAVLFSLLVIRLGLSRFVPYTLLKTMRMVGDCTLPLAMFVVGGNLASVSFARIDKKKMFFMVLAKLVLLPALGLLLVLKFRFPEFIGLLILIQLAVPAATTLSVLVRHYKKPDLLISQGIFISHLASLLSIPVFLSLYFAFSVIK